MTLFFFLHFRIFRSLQFVEIVADFVCYPAQCAMGPKNRCTEMILLPNLLLWDVHIAMNVVLLNVIIAEWWKEIYYFSYLYPHLSTLTALHNVNGQFLREMIWKNCWTELVGNFAKLHESILVKYTKGEIIEYVLCTVHRK